MQHKVNEMSVEFPADLLDALEDMTSEILALEQLVSTVAACATVLPEQVAVMNSEPMH